MHLLKNTVPVKRRKICLQKYSFPKRQCRKKTDLDLLWKLYIFLFSSDILKSKENKNRKKISLIRSELKQYLHGTPPLALPALTALQESSTVPHSCLLLASCTQSLCTATTSLLASTCHRYKFPLHKLICYCYYYKLHNLE